MYDSPTTSRLLPNNLKLCPSSMTSTPDVPPFTGYVETTLHALRLIHAARQGVIPRITRRLNDSERRTMIKSGAVFVFSVEESGIKRWTDGLLWSPSRIVGNFLVYREINERTSSRVGQKKTYPLDSQSRCSTGRRNSPDHHPVAFKGPGHLAQGDHGTFKVNGLIKKTITVTIEGSDLHLISYYTSEDIRSGRLKKPTSRSDIMALPMPPHIFRLTNFRVPPKIEPGPDGKSRLVCEAEDLETPAECKLEEPIYDISGSTQWTPHSDSIHHSPRMDGSYTAGSVYHDSHSHTIPSPGIYNRESTADKWPVSLDNLRIAPITRPDFHDSWSSSPSPTHPHSISRRRDSNQGHSTGSWSALHSQSARWRSDSYSSSAGHGNQLDRSRGRSNTVYDTTNMGHHRRDSEAASRYGLSTDVGDSTREGAPQRSAWLPREVPSNEKYLRSSHVGSSFTGTSANLPFSQHHNYPRMNSTFGTWTSSDGGDSLEAPLHSIQSHAVAMGSYETSYTQAEF